MPIFLILPRDTQALFDWTMKSMREVFKRLGERLAARQLGVAEMVRETASIPVLRFYNEAVVATLDGSQYGALVPVIPDGLTVEVQEDPARVAFGLGRVPAGFNAAVSIPGLLKAFAAPVARVNRFLATPDGKGLVAMVSPGGAYTRFMSHPGTPMSQAMIQAAPRFAGSIAAIIDTLASFIGKLGGGDGPKRLYEFRDGLAALMEAIPAGADKKAEEATDLLGLIRDITRYIGLALVGIPWLGMYIPALLRTATIGIKLATLAAVEKIETQAWDFRKSVLKLFFVDLEVYRRMALSYLATVQEILESLFGYYVSFAEGYLAEFSSNLSEWAKKLTEMFAKIIKYIQYFAIVVAAVGAIILPGPVPLPPSVLRPSSRNASFTPFPDIAETLFGPRADNPLLQAVKQARATTENFVKDILKSGADLLNEAAVGFIKLRDLESRVSVAQRFGNVVRDGEARVRDLMDSPTPWLNLPDTGSDALTRLAAPFESAFAGGGFQLIGAVVPGYVKGLRDFWLRERSTGPRPTSPHLLAKHARHLQVRVPDLTIRATGRPTDKKLAALVAAQFRIAIDQAYRTGREKFLAAPAG